jgi:RNA polymerase sigma-70 factor (ECF subfamily)
VTDEIEPFARFYRDHYLRLVLFLMHSGASLQEAEDAAQETMAGAFETWSGLRDPAAWVRVVAYRKHVASSVRTRRSLASWVRAGAPHEETELFTDQERLVINVLRQLPPSQREVMAWFYDGYRPVEIAAKVGKPATTVRSDLRHRRRLRPTTSRPGFTGRLELVDRQQCIPVTPALSTRLP